MIVLIIGANGQIEPTELAAGLGELYGSHFVDTAGVEPCKQESNICHDVLDVMQKEHLQEVMKRYNIAQIYHLATLPWNCKI